MADAVVVAVVVAMVVAVAAEAPMAAAVVAAGLMVAAAVATRMATTTRAQTMDQLKVRCGVVWCGVVVWCLFAHQSNVGCGAYLRTLCCCAYSNEIIR